MYVLENHYEGKPTIIIHDRIINGCQDFTLEEADGIIREYEVSEEQWNQVLEILNSDEYTGVSTDEQIMKFIAHEDRSVRLAVAMYGNDTHRFFLINDHAWRVREAIVKHGNNEHRNTLMKDEDWHVRANVAEYGNDKHRDILVNDKHYDVRAIVAEYGNDGHRDILVNDESWCVREVVAQCGNDKHRDVLMNDEEWYVRQVVSELMVK